MRLGRVETGVLASLVSQCVMPTCGPGLVLQIEHIGKDALGDILKIVQPMVPGIIHNASWIKTPTSKTSAIHKDGSKFRKTGVNIGIQGYHGELTWYDEKLLESGRLSDLNPGDIYCFPANRWHSINNPDIQDRVVLSLDLLEPYEDLCGYWGAR